MSRWFLILPLLAATTSLFEDASPSSGITFHHHASKTSRKYLIESTTGGVALFDYDNDGWLDIYFVNGATLTDPMPPGATPAKSDPKFFNRLYRNKHDGSFEDVTVKAKLQGFSYDMGVATGDFDNDGDTDLYLTGFPRNTLYRNNNDGTFTDITALAGVPGGGWSSSATFVDIDHDGFLDLFAARYVHWDFEPDIWCGARDPRYRSYCHPDQFKPISHLLYRNNRNGTFTDISQSSNIAKSPGKGLGVAIADFDRDGRIDIAVANDSVPQQLFRNLGNSRFEEKGFDLGIAYDDDGNTYGGMGIDFADYDNDGWPDLFINALSSQRYALYRNLRGTFEYFSSQSGIGPATRLNSGWGAHFLDYDSDGFRDLLVAQGHVMDNIQLTQPNLAYKEPLKLLRQVNGKFIDTPAFPKPLSARGAAFGDINNDGKIDTVINCLDDTPVLLINRAAAGNWIQLRLTGSKSNRDAIGALVTVTSSSGSKQYATLSTTSSYLAAHDPRLHFGFGAATPRLIEITWPSGQTQSIANPQPNRLLAIREP